jgi:hypothetical protein
MQSGHTEMPDRASSDACGYVSWKMGIGSSELSGFGTFEVGKLAESEGYHPDISFGWSSATVSAVTAGVSSAGQLRGCRCCVMRRRPRPEWLRIQLLSPQRPAASRATVPDRHGLARLVRLVAGAREGERNDLANGGEATERRLAGAAQADQRDPIDGRTPVEQTVSSPRSTALARWIGFREKRGPSVGERGPRSALRRQLFGELLERVCFSLAG